MPYFAFDLAALGEHIALLDRTVDEFETNRELIAAAVGTVLAAYPGTDANAFARSHETWRQRFDDDLEELKAHRSLVSGMQHSYAEARRKNLEMFPGRSHRRGRVTEVDDR